MSRHLLCVLVGTSTCAVAYSLLVSHGHFAIANFFSVTAGFLFGSLPTERLSARIVALEDQLRLAGITPLAG